MFQFLAIFILFVPVRLQWHLLICLRYKEMQSSRLLDSLVSAHREMQTHAGGNRDESLLSMVTDVLTKVPEDISKENASKEVFQLHQNSQTGLCELTPLSNFLKGELCSYNALLAFIRMSLTHLLEVRLSTEAN